MRAVTSVALVSAVVFAARADQADIARYDKNMAVEWIVVTNGVKWIDGRLPPERLGHDVARPRVRRCRPQGPRTPSRPMSRNFF